MWNEFNNLRDLRGPFSGHSISPINAKGKMAKCTKCRIYMRMPKTLTILTVVDPHLQDSRETEAREGASDTWVPRLTEPGTPPPSCRGNPVPPPAQCIQYPVLDKAPRISIRRVIWILASDIDTIYIYNTNTERHCCPSSTSTCLLANAVEYVWPRRKQNPSHIAPFPAAPKTTLGFEMINTNIRVHFFLAAQLRQGPRSVSEELFGSWLLIQYLSNSTNIHKY